MASFFRSRILRAVSLNSSRSSFKTSGPSATFMSAAAIMSVAVNRQKHEQRPAHHANDKETSFINPWPSYGANHTSSRLMDGYHMLKDWEKHPMPGKDDMVAVRKPDWGRNGTISEAEYAKDIKATWLGHACFLVEFPTPSSTTSTAQQPRGLRVLFDPVFEHRCSPSQLVGPARYTPPPIPIKELPEVDAVVISHSHYDHTSVDSLQQIYKQQNRGSVHFFVPLGMKKWMKSINIPNEHITELDWWDNAVLTSKAEAEAESGNQLRFTCTPCQHFSGRGLFDRDATLWASWAVEAVSASAGPPACKVWFGGDTAYKAVPKGCTPEEEKLLPVCPAFKEIGQRFGGFDLALIPIGAYSPRWFMSRVHANPEDSVEIHSDIRSRRSVGIHWGTWQLTDERVMEPPERLAAAAKAKGLGADEFTTLEAIGATLRVGVGA